MLRTSALALVALVVAGFATSDALSATFYVRPTGSDRAGGKRLAAAWRTVARVNAARLAPGDVVLFEGGATFSDATLMPSTSGTPGRPIRFSSFGKRRARIVNPSGAVWFSGKSHLVFDRLWLSSGGSSASVVAGSSAGSSAITVSRAVVTGTSGVGIIAPVREDVGWRLECNIVQGTGDSGIIFLGSGFLLSGNVIRDTGLNLSIGYGKHGVYAKGPGSVIRSNVVERFSAVGLSLRAPNTIVLGNTIIGGPIAIAFHDESPEIGSSVLQGNLGFRLGKVGFYFAPESPNGADPPAERFALTGNRFDLADIGLGFDIKAAERSLLTFSANRSKSSTAAAPVPSWATDARWRGCTGQPGG